MSVLLYLQASVLFMLQYKARDQKMNLSKLGVIDNVYWPQAVLIATTLFASHSAIGAPSSEPHLSLDKLLVSLVTVVAAHALIPVIRHYIASRNKRHSYMSFLKSNVQSSISHFGGESTPAFIEANFIPIKPKWIDLLEANGLGVPRLLLSIYDAVQKYDNDENYIPYITYGSLQISEITHDHPIWMMGKVDTKVISDYFVTESAVKEPIDFLYSKDSAFSKYAFSELEIERKRWKDNCHTLISELADHYINTLKLNAYLKAHH
jgi:hypothetical protein